MTTQNPAQKAAHLKAALKAFTGTENWYRHALFRQFLYTDGVKFLAGEAECYWLLDRIFALQYEQNTLQAEGFQSWDLIVQGDKTALLKCHDGNYHPLHTETIPYTDFPLPKITLFLIDNVLLLTTEY